MKKGAWTIGEQRLTFLMREVGSNAAEWGRDIRDEYLVGPWQRGDNIQKIAGPFAAAASTVLELPDYLFAGAVDQRVEHPRGIFGRTRRDLGELLGNVVRLRPLRAVRSGWSLATADIPLDGIDMLGGFHRN